jgi:hypothetical protein
MTLREFVAIRDWGALHLAQAIAVEMVAAE